MGSPLAIRAFSRARCCPQPGSRRADSAGTKNPILAPNATVRNNCLECDHGKLKRLILPTLGFQSMKTAYAHDRLDVLMFDEILTYLPAKHLDAFVKMNDEKRSRGEIDQIS
jgi:hypothetical protein